MSGPSADRGGVLAFLRGAPPPQANPALPRGRGARPRRPRPASEVFRRAADAPPWAPWELVGEYAAVPGVVFSRLSVGPGELREGDLVRAQQGMHRVHGFVVEGLARRLPRVGDLPDLWPYVREWALAYGDDWAEAWWASESATSLAQVAGRAGFDPRRLARLAVAVAGDWSAPGGRAPDVGPAARALLAASSRLLDLPAWPSTARREAVAAVEAGIETVRADSATDVTQEGFERNMAATSAGLAALEVTLVGGASVVPHVCESLSSLVDAEAHRAGRTGPARPALVETLRREWLPLRAVLSALRGVRA